MKKTIKIVISCIIIVTMVLTMASCLFLLDDDYSDYSKPSTTTHAVTTEKAEVTEEQTECIEQDNLIFTVKKETCSVRCKNKSVLNVEIPDTINGKKVTEIEKNAFFGCQYLLSITLPDSIETIGFKAFYGCNNLKQIDIPQNCTFIGEAAFSECSNLQSVTLPDGLKVINSYTFCKCGKLTDVNIPNAIETVGYEAFKDCKISKAIFPNGVKKIESYAFTGCYQLKEVYLPDSIEKLGKWSFSGCNQLSKANIPNSITELEEGVFSASSIKEITIPSSIQKIGAYALNSFELSKVYFSDPEIWFIGNNHIEKDIISNPQKVAKYFTNYVTAEWKKMK